MKILLYTNLNAPTQPDQIVLSDSFLNYKFLSFVCCDTTNIDVRYTLFASTDAIKDAMDAEEPYYMRPTNSSITGWNFIPSDSVTLNRTTKYLLSLNVTPIYVYGIS